MEFLLPLNYVLSYRLIERYIAPIEMEAGNTYWLLLPTIIRAICGIINPTQPIIPAVATAAAVINVAPIMTSHFSFVTEIPSEFASSSDKR